MKDTTEVFGFDVGDMPISEPVKRYVAANIISAVLCSHSDDDIHYQIDDRGNKFNVVSHTDFLNNGPRIWKDEEGERRGENYDYAKRLVDDHGLYFCEENKGVDLIELLDNHMEYCDRVTELCDKLEMLVLKYKESFNSKD